MVRLADWPRAPYLNDEVRTWVTRELKTLGVDEIAVYAVEAGEQDEMRRILVATEIGLLDQLYAPTETPARYRLIGRLYPWQAVRGVDLRVETFRLWALEDRTRWSLRMARPVFRSVTDEPGLGSALCDFAKVCAVMAEPSGWPPPEETVDDSAHEAPISHDGERAGAADSATPMADAAHRQPPPEAEPAEPERPRERPRSIGPFRR